MPTKLSVECPKDFIKFCKDDVQQGIHQRFEQQTLHHPASIALKTRELASTYAETNGIANSIADKILSTCGIKLSRAAILMPNTPAMVFSILGVMKANKTYVPLDPSFPKDRLQLMLEDAEPTILLTDNEHFQFAEELVGRQHITIFNITQIQHHFDAPNPEAPCDPLDLAYILYTSGSTGRPKGMAGSHRNLLHTTMCLTNRLFFSPSDRVTWLHSASFSASFVDIYCCLTNGGTLYPWEAKTQGFTRLAEWLDSEQVTTFQWIPSAFRQFLRTVPEDFVFKNIRIVVMASEPLTVREVEKFRRHFPMGSHLVNQLGSSESYNYRLYAIDHHIPIENANVAGGYAVSEDRQVVILNEDHCCMPVGEAGEIGIKSNYMSAGYWRDESLTQSKFINIQGDTTPVFLTGDIGKLDSDGCLQHLGRKDFQVKIRGFRVELAEIDHVLSKAPAIADSVTWVVKTQSGEDQLVGYLVLDENGQFEKARIDSHLRSQLPEYMVPSCYVILSSLPTLPTGKINRGDLPNPFEQAEHMAQTSLESTNENSATQEQSMSGIEVDEIQKRILGLFEELLQVENLNSDSDFLKLGGDSLLTAILITRIYQWFDIEITFDDFINTPTPARLANLVTQQHPN